MEYRNKINEEEIYNEFCKNDSLEQGWSKRYNSFRERKLNKQDNGLVRRLFEYFKK